MNKKDILIITPPITQVNSPYPAAMYLSSFLKQHNYGVEHFDLSIELVDNIYTSTFIESLISKSALKNRLSFESRRFIDNGSLYINLVDQVKDFLRGKNQTLANRIANRTLLPEGPRFSQIQDVEWWFGSIGKTDLSRHLSTLFLLDIADFIRENESSFFEFSKYGERLSKSLPTFDPLENALKRGKNLVDKLIVSLFESKIIELHPHMVAFTVPFPGNLYSSLLCSKFIKENFPNIPIVMGGGYVSTELRKLSDPRIFDYVDYLVFDDGELPLLRLMNYIGDKRTPLLRTMIRKEGEVHLMNSTEENVNLKLLPAPDFSGIDSGKYLSLMEMPNPMHSLWNNGFWNKMQLARGCYWAKCTFCDTSLPYIASYDSQGASKIVDDIEKIIGQTGQTGFHFVDEAAPPHILRKVAEEIIKRKLVLTWWTNIRFEKNFTIELCNLMAKSGCIAVTGGIEVASDRVLDLINKGVTLEQAALSCKNFRDSGIMVHTYLMYGFPSQTDQEVVDSLEIVRQFFKHNLIQSGFWHRYAMTYHSETGIHPDKFGVSRVSNRPNPFANNEVEWVDTGKCDYSAYTKGLEKSIYNYIHGIGIEEHISFWFDFKIPNTKIAPDYIANTIGERRRPRHKK